MLIHSCPVYEDMDQVYEIVFDDYVIYQNRNESYTVWDDYEIRKGNYLIIFEKARLLDYYENVLVDFDDEETKREERKHYGIYTENHILDVISNSEPRIQKLEIRQNHEKRNRCSYKQKNQLWIRGSDSFASCRR